MEKVLIEVFAHNECFKGCSLKVCPYSTVSAYTLEAYRHFGVAIYPRECSYCLGYLQGCNEKLCLAHSQVELSSLTAQYAKPRPTEEAKCLDCCTAIPFGYEVEEVTELSL